MNSDAYWDPQSVVQHTPFLLHSGLAHALVKRVRPAEGATYLAHPNFELRWLRDEAVPAACYESEDHWIIEMSALFVARLHAWFNAAVVIARVPPETRPAARAVAFSEIQAIVDNREGATFDQTIHRLLSYATGGALPRRPEANRFAMLAIAFVAAHEVGHLCCGHPQWLVEAHGSGLLREGDLDSVHGGTCTPEESLALELLADTMACELLWHELSCESYGALLGTGMPGDIIAKQRAMFSSTKTSIRCLFMTLDRWFGTDLTAGSDTHPSGIIRAISMDAVMNSLQIQLMMGGLLDSVEGQALETFGYMASSGMFVDGGLQAALEYHRPLASVREFLTESPGLNPMALLWKTTFRIQNECSDLALFPAAFTFVDGGTDDVWCANSRVFPQRMIELLEKLAGLHKE